MPDLVISAGTAGGFRSSTACIGDVFVSSKCIFHSRRIPAARGVYEEYGFGHFRSPPLAGLARQCGLKIGVVSTSDSLDASPRDLELLRAEGAAVKEMEAAAIAWVCQQLHVDFFALKSITDIVDRDEVVPPPAPASLHPTDSCTALPMPSDAAIAEGETQEQFYRNLAHASSNLQAKLVAVLECLGNSTLSDWRAAAAARL